MFGYRYVAAIDHRWYGVSGAASQSRYVMRYRHRACKHVVVSAAAAAASPPRLPALTQVLTGVFCFHRDNEKLAGQQVAF